MCLTEQRRDTIVLGALFFRGAMKKNDEPVGAELDAELRQIKSLVDHTYNITLNVPEYCLPQVQLLMGWLLDSVHVVIVRTN